MEKFDLTKSKIVLGHPFSGALYAYFDKVLNDGRHIEASSYHGYYKTLYGNHFEYNIDIALALSLVFDNIILTQADNPIPDSQKYLADNEYYNPDFGLYTCSADEIIHYDFLNEKVFQLLQDTTIKAILSPIPKSAYAHIIREAYLDVELANKFSAPLFTQGTRQALVQRISEIEKFKNTEMVTENQVKMIKNYIEISSLLFQPMNIDSFYYLKSDKNLKEYSSSFQKILNKYNPEHPDIKKDLLLNIKEAMAKDSLNGKISGIFQGSSSVLNYAGFIPIPQVSLAAGIAGIGGDLAARGIDRLNEKNKWFEFAPQIQKSRSMENIKRKLDKFS